MNYLSPHEEGPQPGIRYRKASDIQPEKIDWLWPQRLPRGEFILYAGLPGAGKSMLSLDCAARITTGAPWPDGSGSPDAGNVAILTHEDDAARTIIPRLQTLGADLDRVLIIDGFGYEDDPERHELFLHRDGIDALRRSIDVDLLIIDTCKSYMTGDLNKAADVARGLRPLIDWAHESKTTIIGIEHLGKANDRGAMQRILGSTALVGQCRFAWVFSRDLQNSDRLLMTRAKGNIAKDVGGLSCRLVADPGEDHPKVIWDSDPVNMTADEALAPP